MKNEITIRPATSEDIEFFFGKKIPHTIRAWVAEYNGVPACLAGVYINGALATGFSELKGDIPKKAIYRGGKMLAEKFKELNIPIQAEAKNGKFLERLGFTMIGSYYGIGYSS